MFLQSCCVQALTLMVQRSTSIALVCTPDLLSQQEHAQLQAHKASADNTALNLQQSLVGAHHAHVSHSIHKCVCIHIAKRDGAVLYDFRTACVHLRNPAAVIGNH